MATDDRRRKIAAIHAAATQLGLDTADKSPDSPYRTVLRVQGGVTSAAQLDEAGRRKVLAYLLKQLQPQGSRPTRAASQAGMIERLWAELGAAGALKDATQDGLAAFVKKRHGVDSHLWLSTSQANQVIEALKAWKARASAKA